MKPLREQFNSSDPNESFGAALLGKVQPLEPSVDRMRRVRIRLHEKRSIPGLALLRTAVIGTLIFAGVTASAMAGRTWLKTRAAEPPAESAAVATPAAAAKPQHSKHVERPAPADGDSIAEIVEPSAIPLEETPRHAPAPAASHPGAKLMMQAMKARRAGDTAKAAELLGEYRRKYPTGPMQEEALALSMEAAASRGDAKNASRMARQYLERFPKGRFREQAQRLLQATPQ